MKINLVNVANRVMVTVKLAKQFFLRFMAVPAHIARKLLFIFIGKVVACQKQEICKA